MRPSRATVRITASQSRGRSGSAREAREGAAILAEVGTGAEQVLRESVGDDAVSGDVRVGDVEKQDRLTGGGEARQEIEAVEVEFAAQIEQPALRRDVR